MSFSISGGSSQINVEINDPAYPFLGYSEWPSDRWNLGATRR